MQAFKTAAPGLVRPSLINILTAPPSHSHSLLHTRAPWQLAITQPRNSSLRTFCRMTQQGSTETSLSDQPTDIKASSTPDDCTAAAQPNGGVSKGLASRVHDVKNIRDFCEALPAVQPGRVIRCARPADASPADVELLVDHIGVRDLLDLRSMEEILEDLPASPLFARASQLVRSRFYYMLLTHLPWRSTLWAATQRLVGQKEGSRLTLIKEVNEGGLGLLYRMLVDAARPELLAALTLITEALEQQRPVLLFCKAGKDRTGLVSALTLHCAGASRQQILDDYVKSDEFHMVALAGIEKTEDLRGINNSVFARAPREAMESVLAYIDQYHGDLSTYLSNIGFGSQQQERLRHLMTRHRRTTPTD